MPQPWTGRLISGPRAGELHSMTTPRNLIREHHRWIVYQTASTPAKVIGFIHAPDEQLAIRAAIKDYRIPVDDRGWLMVRRREL
jgi:hypothetical protein